MPFGASLPLRRKGQKKRGGLRLAGKMGTDFRVPRNDGRVKGSQGTGGTEDGRWLPEGYFQRWRDLTAFLKGRARVLDLALEKGCQICRFKRKQPLLRVRLHLRRHLYRPKFPEWG